MATGANWDLPPPGDRNGVAMFVSTALASWIAPQPDVFARDVQLNDTTFRQLDPEYYAWLRSKMRLAKMSVDAGRLGQAEFEQLRCRFNGLQEWAIGRFGEPQLLDAVRDLNVRDYVPPVAEPDASRGVPQRAQGIRLVVLAVARPLVDEIRDRALALGWTHARLYQVPGAVTAVGAVGAPSADGIDGTRISANAGLVCYLRDGWSIGDVTREFIETIGPPPLGVRQCFYNPDVDQPWIRRYDGTKNILRMSGQMADGQRI